MRLFDPGPVTLTTAHHPARRDDPDGPGTQLLDADGSAIIWRGWLEDTAVTMAALFDEVALSQRTIRVAGREVRQPRLDAWIADPDALYTYSGVAVMPRPWTPATRSLRERLSVHCGCEFNSVLVNYYRDGSDSMGEHADDEPELGATPVIASLSLGGSRRLRFRHRVDRTSIAVDLHDGDLLVMSGPTQQWWRHGIAKTATPVTGRLNLTYRLVVNGVRELPARQFPVRAREGESPSR